MVNDRSLPVSLDYGGGWSVTMPDGLLREGRNALHLYFRAPLVETAMGDEKAFNNALWSALYDGYEKPLRERLQAHYSDSYLLDSGMSFPPVRKIGGSELDRVETYWDKRAMAFPPLGFMKPLA